MNYTVFRRAGRQFFECQWVDPVTGKKCTRSTKKTKESEARNWAADHFLKLASGVTVAFDKVTWEQTRKRYTDEVLPNLSRKTGLKTNAMFAALKRHVDPKLLMRIDATVISRFSSALRASGLRPFTVRGHLGELRKVLRWAHRQGLLAKVPAFELPAARGMKGRPITTEEFERFLAKIPSVFPDKIAAKVSASWVHLVRGLWLSGLRLEEAMTLHWTSHRNAWVDLTGKNPVIVFRSHAQKNREDDVCPITPDFAAFLLETPESGRHGFVFNPIPFCRRSTARPSAEWVGKILTRIGEKASIKVSERADSDGNTEVKWASAHDFRRSFGTRWSSIVMPATLQRLMRHRSITTTMSFYVRQCADMTADEIRRAVANEIANKIPKPTENQGAPDATSSNKSAG